MANNNNRNEYVVNQELQVPVRNQMQEFKTEVASELGLTNYETLDKGELTSRQNGYVGGNMTKKMVLFSEMVISQQGSDALKNTNVVLEIPERIRLQNEQVSQNRQLNTQNIQGQIQ